MIERSAKNSVNAGGLVRPERRSNASASDARLVEERGEHAGLAGEAVGEPTAVSRGIQQASLPVPTQGPHPTANHPATAAGALGK